MGEQPDRGPDWEGTAREHEAAGRLEAASQAWAGVARSRPVGPERASALVEQARLKGDPDTKAALYRRALVNDPGNEAAVDALAAGARDTGSWMLLANLQRLRFSRERDASRCAAIALEAGRLELERLDSPGAARGWFREGLERDPEQQDIVAALVEIERRRGDEAALLVTLERLIELKGSAAAPSELLEAASLRAGRGEQGRALAHLERASTCAPEDALVLEALAEVLAALDRPTDLADVLERRAALAGEDPGTRAAVLVELGTLQEERLFDPEAALDAFQRALAADRRSATARDAIARLRAKLGVDAGASPSEADPPPSDAPGPGDDTLAQLEREARSTHDRARLSLLVRDIESAYRHRGSPEAALPFVQRWVLASPEDPEALRTLARIHETPGHEAELTATLEALDPLLELGEQASNRLKLAALYESRGRLDDAVRAYQRALAIEPRHLEALEALEVLLRDRGDTKALVAVLERILELREPRRRTECLIEIAELREASGDIAGAIATRQRLEDQPDVPAGSEERLDALLERAGRHEETEERLRRRGERFDPGSAEAIATELRRGRLLLDALGRPDEAAAIYRAVLVHAPESPDAKAGLERALRTSIDASGLAAFLAEQAESSADPAERDRACFERAVLLEEVLDRPEDATDAYRSLIDTAETPELRNDASYRYDRLLQRSGQWQALREHLESCLGRGDTAEEVALHERLARLCGDQLHDETRELRHLERVAELDPSRADVWRVLSDRFEQGGDTERQMHAMESELAAGCDSSRRLTLHARLAELHLQVRKDPVSAREHYERVFEIDPSHAAAAQYLIGRYDRDRRPEEVIRVLEKRLAALEGATSYPADEAKHQRTALRVHLANVRATRLDDLEGAISALEVALGEVGPSPQVAEPLAACYQRAGYALDLIELSRSAAAACSDSAEAANWHVRMADAFLARDRPREAAEAYRQALSARPDDRAVQASLRAIYRRLEQHEPLASLLDAELSHLAGPDEVPVRMELAKLQAERLARPADALLHAQRVLQLAPRHPEAFELALGLARDGNRHELALDLLDTRLEHAGTTHERAELLARRAELLASAFGQPGEAIESLRASLVALPDEARHARLASLLESEGRTQEWLEVIGEQAREATPHRRAELLEHAAATAWTRISPDAALPWLERLTTLRPDDVEVRLRIAQAHRTAGRTESLLNALSSAQAHTTIPMQRRNLQLERAALLEREQNAPGRAIAALMDARDAVPGDADVLGRLARLQGALGRHAERAETLERLLAVSSEDALELHQELARLLAGTLREPERAIQHWRAALGLAPRQGRTRSEILRALSETYRRVGDRERWAATAEEELASLGAQPVFDDRRRVIRRELAFGYWRELSRPEAALRHARALLDAGEDDLLGVETLDRLESMVLELLHRTDAPIELEARLARHLARRPEQPALWLELARVREEKLQSTAAAIEAFRQALELDPGCLPALRGLRSAAERLGRFGEVAAAMERELEHPEITDPAVRSALLRRLGDVYWHRLQSTTRASRCYARALEENGADFAALRAFERLLEAMEDWRGALDLYESEVEVLADENPQRRREIWLHVAGLARDRTDDVERARRALRRAAEVAALEPAQLRELADLHERADDPEAFVETFADWCDAAGDAVAPEDTLRLAACLESLGRREEALERALLAVASEPKQPHAWDVTARLREALSDPAGAAEALRGAAWRAPAPEAASRLLRAARLVETRDPEQALGLLREAVGRDPAAAEAQAARARLALRCGALAEAESAAAQALDLTGEPGLDADERLEIALIGGDAARSIGHLEQAAGFYGRACESHPCDPRATGAYGETLAQLGDTSRAREALAARLALGDAYPERASHRATLALCFEAEQSFDDALDAARAALDDDPRQETALGVQVRVHEALGHVDEAVEATVCWAASTPETAERAARLLRAAEWEVRSGEREASAEAHLRQALAADADLVPAWILLVSLLAGQGRLAESIACADRAASHAQRDEDLGLLALLQGRAHEQHGDRAHAAESFGMAAEADPRCAEAALAQARLLRGAGDWRAAADALQHFLERHPEPEHPDLGPVHEQLGRLLAGPLEDVEGAVTSYRRAIALAPDPLAPHAALAELLSHRPGNREEALAHLRLLLAADPTDAAALRVGLRLARQNPTGAGVAVGIEVLRALGLASSYERDEVQTTPDLAPEPVLADPRFELLRSVASLAADAIAEALEASEDTSAPEAPAPEAAFRSALLRCEGQLAAAALVPLPTREVSEVLELVVRLSVEPETVRGDGRLVNALSAALRRRLRRRLRRQIGDVPVEELCRVDFDDWRLELRALAAGLAIGEAGCSLRTALVSLVRDESDSLDHDVRELANLKPRVAASPVARALLGRIVAGWLERI